MNTREILSHIPDLRHLDSGMFLLMAGPCVVENETMLRQVAETACRITERLRIPYIFKASYRKANRSRIDSFSGIGDLEALRMLGANVDVVRTPLFDRAAALEGFAERIPGADCVVCTHVSNVFGFVLPVYAIAELCREHGVPFILDASQSAGALPVDMAKLGADFIAMPGHKGLLGPQGTGVLLCKYPPSPLMAGGTGSMSLSQDMPEFLPDRLEAGTHNIPGIAGLLAGVEYIERRGISAIELHERRLMRAMAQLLRTVPGLEVFLSEDMSSQAGVLSIRHERVGSEELGEALGKLGVCVRAGLHCAPYAHESAGTLETGTVRLSVSPFNTTQEIHRVPGLVQRALELASGV